MTDTGADPVPKPHWTVLLDDGSRFAVRRSWGDMFASEKEFPNELADTVGAFELSNRRVAFQSFRCLQRKEEIPESWEFGDFADRLMTVGDDDYVDRILAGEDPDQDEPEPEPGTVTDGERPVLDPTVTPDGAC